LSEDQWKQFIDRCWPLFQPQYSVTCWKVVYMPARNMLQQLLALYTNPESRNAQRHRQTDGRQDDPNSRSYCVCSSTIG